jgi:hypothetical protein
MRTKVEIVLPRIAMRALGAERGLPFTVRTARPEDFRFIDSLQKKFSSEVGFLPRAAMEAHIAKGRVSIGFENDEPAGYILIKERYQGDPAQAILYQCAIEYSAQRHLLGSSLLEHAISLCPSPPVKVASAWVAQDIEANFFWEKCGFEPIAARRGSKRKGRVHIYWQRKVQGITGQRPVPPASHLNVIPKVTRGGLMREKRAVIKIEAGMEWRNLRPEDFPEVEEAALTPDPSGLTCGPKAGARGEQTLSVEQLRRKFVQGASEWMWVIINGVGRYLPVMVQIEVPEFMDLPGQVSVAVGGESAAHSFTGGTAVPRLPSSRIPGLAAA